MLHTFQDTAHYAQPRSPITVDGERYMLPPDLITGLDFMRRFTNPKGEFIEGFVHAFGNRLDILTNSIAIDYEIGPCELPAISFNPYAIRLLAAFGMPPTCLEIETTFGHSGNLFRWDDGQECFLDINYTGDYPPSAQARRDLMERHLTSGGFTIDNATRTNLLRLHKRSVRAGSAKDIYISRDTAISRQSSDGKSWTSETLSPFPFEVERPMRFDRDAFLRVIRVADEIDFSTSPVSFRHANGRGLLIERTLGSDVPESEWSDD